MDVVNKNLKYLLLVLAGVGILAAIVSFRGVFPFRAGGNDDISPSPTVIENKEETMTVRVYFNNSRLDPEFSCNKVFPVERKTVKAQAPARVALEELLKGASEAEKGEGFFTSIGSGVKIQNLIIENRIAKADFSEELEFQIGGSCRVSAIRAQITQTLKQFPSVDSVVISIDGRTEDILQP